MKPFIFIFLFLSFLLKGCSGSPYHPAPLQDLPPVSDPSVSITILNGSFGNVEFFEGPLEGLILSPWEWYQADLPLGYQSHSWRQQVLHKSRIIDYSDEIIVTHRSKTLRIIAPPRDDLFYTRGSGRLEVKDY